MARPRGLRFPLQRRRVTSVATTLLALAVASPALEIKVSSGPGATESRLEIFHAPQAEPLGALELSLHFRSAAGEGAASSITAFKPSAGPWSQVAPALKRDGAAARLTALAPSWLGKTEATAWPIAELLLQHDALADGVLLDSLSVRQALSTEAQPLTLPALRITTVGLRPPKERREPPRFRRDGRLHRLTFRLAKASRVRVRVQDLQGKTAVPVYEGKMPAGLQEVVWDGGDAKGRPVRPGLYFLRLEAGAFTYDRKVEVLP